AGFTAFYMTRLGLLVFFGRPRAEGAAAKAHESPPVMVGPLVALAALSAVAGIILAWGKIHFVSFVSLADTHAESGMIETPASTEHLVTVLATLAAATGIAVAWLLYVKRPELPALLSARFAGLFRALTGKWFVDE